MDANDVKAELNKGIEKLATLRDEAKLHLHLASLDAKQEWDDKLEPSINDLQTKAADLGDTGKIVVLELVDKVEAFVSKLRGQSTEKKPS